MTVAKLQQKMNLKASSNIVLIPHHWSFKREYSQDKRGREKLAWKLPDFIKRIGVVKGALVTVCADDSVHLWNIRQKQPEIVHTLKFQKERITYACLPFQSKWLYIGTERGNVHIVNVEAFILSGYVINWNKAVEISRKSHPGVVVHLSDNPVDPNKPLRSASWHHEGRQFMCSYNDGSLRTWNIKYPSKPESTMFPHAKTSKDKNLEMCHAITKVDWRTARGRAVLYVVFEVKLIELVEMIIYRLGSGEYGQHPCPPQNRRACRKGPVQHEFYVDVSRDSRVQWSDETRQLLYVLATGEDF
ncbi:syntaxin-binding protein 5-like [Trichonephila clavipes]|uniref:Syntaxin-binding protein 5-like n=1 Tax=Trichonephila clavipes TaxID=2585209 RepID=A0A8X6SGZ0_TRICX|nr:syntaxin-binding protein 5-like [Trichonephila clavipes]